LPPYSTKALRVTDHSTRFKGSVSEPLFSMVLSRTPHSTGNGCWNWFQTLTSVNLTDAHCVGHPE
jgi:hypothetical protein